MISFQMFSIRTVEHCFQRDMTRFFTGAILKKRPHLCRIQISDAHRLDENVVLGQNTFRHVRGESKLDCMHHGAIIYYLQFTLKTVKLPVVAGERGLFLHTNGTMKSINYLNVLD